MNSRPLILITRPAADDGEFSRRLMMEGYKIFHEPMLEIAAEDFQIPDLSVYDALIFTSRHAVKIFSAQVTERKITVYAVGPQTAEMLASAHFEKMIVAVGDGASLNEVLSRNPPPGDGRLLYIRGRDVAGAVIAPPGFQIEELIVYRAEKATHLSDACRAHIESGRIAAATFFSVRTAEAFVALAREKGIESGLKATKALCISQGVVECVRPISWAGTYAAQTPDRQGMIALVQKFCPLGNTEGEAQVTAMTNTTDQPADQSALKDAEKIIERFGGIRPMASKINVPVTTVQGWKKRNVIPGTRRADILAAARIHNINLDDLLSGGSGVANQNDQARNVEAPVQSDKSAVHQTARPSVPSAGSGEIDQKLASTKKSAITASTVINVIIALLLVGAVIALLWPETKENSARIGVLESDMDAVQEEQSFLRELIPDDLAQKFDALKEQAAQLRDMAVGTTEVAKTVSADVLAEDAGSMNERMARLEGHVADLGSPQIAAVLERVRSWQQSMPGRARLGQTITELNSIIAGLGAQPEQGQLNTALDSARAQSSNLNETFQGVPAQDLKAAALLLGLTQFRESLNRDNQPFDQDMQLLMNLVGEENTELRDALTRLAPQAQSGVLTPTGLSNEFRTMAGDIVVSSLKGEDVSVQEKARARMNEVFAVEKNGELITGTDTQAKVARTQKMIDEGNIEGALSELQTLEGPAAQAAQPFIDKAQVTLMAEKVKQMLSQAIDIRAYGPRKGGITANSGPIFPSVPQPQPAPPGTGL